MRAIAIGLLLLTACDRNVGDEQLDKPVVEPKPAGLTFDGAGATDPAALVKHGERLSWVLGCRGCHGPDLQGKNFTASKPGNGAVYASNLTQALPRYSDDQVEAMMRRGVHPERAKLWIMPSEIFQHLSDADLKALVAHLRALPPQGDPSPPPVLGPKVSEKIARGEFKSAAEYVRDPEYRLPQDFGAATAKGRYIAAVTCAECHGGQLQGGGDTPDLLVAAAYSREEFERLLTTGVPPGGRKLRKLMVNVAQRRFAKLTRAERDALHSYLTARAERPQ